MPSFDQYLGEFFSKPRTLEAQLLAPNAEAIQAVCTATIPAFAKVAPTECQELISQFAGNTPAGVPLWAVAIKPDFFKKVRPHFRKSMWKTSTRGDGYGSGRADLYSLQFVDLTAKMWQSIIDARVFVKHLSPPFRFTGRRGSCGSHVTEVNIGVTAVRKSDAASLRSSAAGYWMHIGRACATPCIEYRLEIEPNDC